MQCKIIINSKIVLENKSYLVYYIAAVIHGYSD